MNAQKSMALNHDQICCFLIFCTCLSLSQATWNYDHGHGGQTVHHPKQNSYPLAVKHGHGKFPKKWLRNVTMWENHLQTFHYNVRLSMVIVHSLRHKSSIAHDIPDIFAPGATCGVPDCHCANRSCASCQVRAIKNHGADFALFVDCRFNLVPYIATTPGTTKMNWGSSFILQDLNMRNK